MRYTFTTILFILFQFAVFSQNKLIDSKLNQAHDITPKRTISDNGTDGIDIRYEFSGTFHSTITKDRTNYSLISIPGFSHSKDIGKPSVPVHQEIIAVPIGAKAEIHLTLMSFQDTAGFIVYPSQAPAPDTYGASEPEFTIDEEFYKTDKYYPWPIVEIIDRMILRGMEMIVVQIKPVLYNPFKKKLRLYSEIEFSVQFTGGNKFIDKNKHSKDFLRKLPSNFLNKESIKREIGTIKSGNTRGNGKNYILVTTNTYFQAANMLSQWKQQLGYTVEVVKQNSWISADVKNTVHSLYQNWEPKPDYLLILGDHTDVPGQTLSDCVSDLYYVCMDGSNDFMPDMARGRISVSSQAEAIAVVQKIIDYEANPPADTSFYSSSAHAAYFQESNTSGYAERRFAQTAEESLLYMENSQNFDVSRIYVTGSSTNPTNWNNGNYSNGEAIPSYLLKPGFAWDGSASDINQKIDEGALYVLHRDHGFDDGWGDPYYDKNHIDNLNNGNLTPIVFSINCLTGKFNEVECFTEKLLRKTPGGAVGVFGHSEVSYSGYNDGLAMGLFDAIWSDPGLVPEFTGSGGVSNPSVITHDPILTMGDVLIHGLVRMVETWGQSQYTFELFHYFGDPAMKIWTQAPSPITATSPSSLQCGQDTVYTVSNINFPGATVTLVIDNELIASTISSSGSADLYFDPIAGQTAIITVSAINQIPYIDTINILGGCPKAAFTVLDDFGCLLDSFFFESNSSGNINTYTWDFGLDATPATSANAGPHTIYYSTPGDKTISLTVSGPNGNHSVSTIVHVNQHCEYYMPSTGIVTTTICNGRLFDDGGSQSNYSDLTYGRFIINPDGAYSISMYFNEFNFEQDYDTLWIFDGDILQQNLIGAYTGNSLPGGGLVTSTTGKVTIIQDTDEAMNESGFDMEWVCNIPNAPPITTFSIVEFSECNGLVSFQDFSSNGPDTWLWDFGDGNTSMDQHPVHIYESDGVFNVTLIASNSFGPDTFIAINQIIIDRPDAPVVEENEFFICGQTTTTLNATSNGYTAWYDSPDGTNILDTGAVFNPFVSTSTTFYAENIEEPQPVFGAKQDNTGGGGNYTYASSHYLVFDITSPCILRSVKVYANGAGNRLIQLKNSNGAVLESTSVYIPDGEQTVELNFELLPGTDYRLVGPESPNLYRNNSGLNYPYDLGGYGTVKHSSASSNPTGYYYFFYNWEIKEEACHSPRVPITVTMDESQPIASFNYNFVTGATVDFEKTSLHDRNYIWYFGDGDTSTIDNPQHTYLEGLYDVKLVVDNACGADSTMESIVIDLSSITTIEDMKLICWPNPATENLNIKFSDSPVGFKKIEIINSIGQSVFVLKLDFEKYEYQIPLDNFSEGIYWIKVDESALTKIVINK